MKSSYPFKTTHAHLRTAAALGEDDDSRSNSDSGTLRETCSDFYRETTLPLSPLSRHLDTYTYLTHPDTPTHTHSTPITHTRLQEHTLVTPHSHINTHSPKLISTSFFPTLPSMLHNYHIAAHCTLCHLLAARPKKHTHTRTLTHTYMHNHTVPDAWD